MAYWYLWKQQQRSRSRSSRYIAIGQRRFLLSALYSRPTDLFLSTTTIFVASPLGCLSLSTISRFLLVRMYAHCFDHRAERRSRREGAYVRIYNQVLGNFLGGLLDDIGLIGLIKRPPIALQVFRYICHGSPYIMAAPLYMILTTLQCYAYARVQDLLLHIYVYIYIGV